MVYFSQSFRGEAKIFDPPPTTFIIGFHPFREKFTEFSLIFFYFNNFLAFLEGGQIANFEILVGPPSAPPK